MEELVTEIDWHSELSIALNLFHKGETKASLRTELGFWLSQHELHMKSTGLHGLHGVSHGSFNICINMGFTCNSMAFKCDPTGFTCLFVWVSQRKFYEFLHGLIPQV